MKHQLKTIQPYFDLIVEGKKNFEIRKNDRDFATKDILILSEYDEKRFIGRQVEKQITYVMHSHKGLCKGYVILGLGEVS